MIKRILSLFAVVFMVFSASAQERDQKTVVWVEMDGVNVPLPPVEHPRLFVRSWEIPALKAKMEHVEGKKIHRNLRNSRSNIQLARR